jgi:hypothetical protein
MFSVQLGAGLAGAPVRLHVCNAHSEERLIIVAVARRIRFDELDPRHPGGQRGVGRDLCPAQLAGRTLEA